MPDDFNKPDRAPLPAELPVKAPPGLLDLSEAAWDTNGSPPAITSGPKLTPRAFLKALGRRWLFASFLGLLFGGAAGVGLWFLRPDTYTAYALLRVTAENPSVLRENASAGRQEDIGRTQKTQAALVTSRPILLEALSDRKIRAADFFREEPDPADWLTKQLQVGFLEGTDIMRIALTDKEPGELPKLVNAVVEAYVNYVDKQERQRRLDLLNQVDKVYTESQEKLRGDRERLKVLAETFHTSDSSNLTLKQKNLLDQYAALTSEVAKINSQLRDAQIKLTILKHAVQLPDQVPESIIERELEKDPYVQQRMLELFRVQDRATADAANIRPGSQIGQPIEQKVAAAQAALDKARAQRRQDVVKRLRQEMVDQSRFTIEQQRREKEEEIAALEAQKKDVDTEVRNKQKDAESIGSVPLELEMRRNDIDQAEAVVRSLRTEKERLAVEIRVNQPRVIRLYPAEVPETPNKNPRIQLAIAGGIGVFLLCLGLVGYSEWRVQRITSTAEVTQELGMRVLGSLPALPTRARIPVGTGPDGMDPSVILLESIDSIRAMLLCDDTIRSHRVLMVTSAGSREGKTTLASHLATSMARVGHSTVLVDADFRRPVIHQLFGIEPTVGLSDVLTRKIALADALVPSHVTGLTLLPAGPMSRRASPTLAQQPVRKVFDELRSRFDFVIVDACPVLPVADALVLGKSADGVLLSVRPHISQGPAVIAAYDRLRALGIQILGVVVTGVRDRPKDYDYLYAVAPQVVEPISPPEPTSEST